MQNMEKVTGKLNVNAKDYVYWLINREKNDNEQRKDRWTKRYWYC